MLEDYDEGDRVYVRWYGGSDMPCVVVEDGGEKRVQKEVRPGEGNGKSLRVGEKEIVEEPKPWAFTAKLLVEEKRRKAGKGWH